MSVMLVFVFAVSFLFAYIILCSLFLAVFKRFGVKIDYKELFLFFLFFDGPTISTDTGKDAKTKSGRFILNFMSDLGINAVYYLILLLSVAAGFAGVYFVEIEKV